MDFLSKEAVMYLTIAVYFVIMIAVGLLSRRSSRTISDFTVGTRSATAWLSAFSYGTAYFSAVMFIGYAGGTGWKYGLWGVQRNLRLAAGVDGAGQPHARGHATAGNPLDAAAF